MRAIPKYTRLNPGLLFDDLKITLYHKNASFDTQVYDFNNNSSYIREVHSVPTNAMQFLEKSQRLFFTIPPLKRSLNRSDGYACAGDRKNWLAEMSPKFCILMKHSG